MLQGKKIIHQAKMLKREFMMKSIYEGLNGMIIDASDEDIIQIDQEYRVYDEVLI